MASTEAHQKAQVAANAARAAKDEADASLERLRERLAQKQKRWAARQARYFSCIERAKSCKRKCDDEHLAAERLLLETKRQRVLDATTSVEQGLGTKVQAAKSKPTLEVDAVRRLSHANNSAAHDTHVSNVPERDIDHQQHVSQPGAGSARPCAQIADVVQLPKGCDMSGSQQPATSSNTANRVKTPADLSNSHSDVHSGASEWQPHVLSLADSLETRGQDPITTQLTHAAASDSPYHAQVEHSCIGGAGRLCQAGALHTHGLAARPAISAPCAYSFHSGAEAYSPSASATGRLQTQPVVQLPSPHRQATLPPLQTQEDEQEERSHSEASSTHPLPCAPLLEAKRKRIRWVEPEPVIVNGKRDRRTSVRVKKYNAEAFSTAFSLASLGVFRSVTKAGKVTQLSCRASGTAKDAVLQPKHASMAALTSAIKPKDTYAPCTCSLSLDRGAVVLKMRSNDLQQMGSCGSCERMLTLTAGGQPFQVRIDRNNNLRAGWAALRTALGITSLLDHVVVKRATPEEEKEAGASAGSMFHFTRQTARHTEQQPSHELAKQHELHPPAARLAQAQQAHDASRLESNRRRRERRQQLRKEELLQQLLQSPGSADVASAAAGSVKQAVAHSFSQLRANGKDQRKQKSSLPRTPVQPLPVPEGPVGIKLNIRANAGHRLYVTAGQTKQLMQGRRRPDTMKLIAEHAATGDSGPRAIGQAVVENRVAKPHLKPGIETMTGWSVINGKDGYMSIEDYSVIGIYPSLEAPDTFHVVKLKGGPCAWGLPKEIVGSKPHLPWCHCTGHCTCLGISTG